MSRGPRSRRRSRLGAILTTEVVVLLPIVTIIFFGLIEMGMLWASNHRLAVAAHVGCRVATLPQSSFEDVQNAVVLALGDTPLGQAQAVRLRRGSNSGDPVLLELRAPMTAGAPDMLSLFGFSLEDRELVAQCVMRRE